MQVTQHQIAARLGLSRAAVGFALSDDPRLHKQVRVETRQQILKTARQLGYRPHRHAQLMRGKKSGLIGVIKTTGIVQTGVERSFFASKAIQAAGYGLLVHELHWDELGVQRAVEVMLDERVEGVLLAGISNPDHVVMSELQRLRDANVPLVAVGGARLPSVPLVATDYRQGMATLTQHLLGLGCRKLALVLTVRPAEANLPQNWGFGERLAGFREAAAAAGLSADQARVMHQPHTTGWTDSYAPGQAVIEHLVARGDRPEALLCSNDEMALGAIRACVNAGWHVPADLAITGFDHTTAGRYACPSLTTVAQPTEAVAKKAVALLLKQVQGEATSPSEMLVKLPCRLVVRQSCGASLKGLLEPQNTRMGGAK